uniref:Thioredoxin domain-containing protein n=1 Tax=Panagrolaimus sp. ES5 TaxID=591445 RepID=A0AC34F9R3_9BILA
MLLQRLAPSLQFTARRMASVFSGVPLKRNGGGSEDSSKLSNKVVGVYFSAHWCPPCRNFTPILKDFYDEISDDDFEIVFVSLDRSEGDLNTYLKEAHGKWLYVPFGDKNIESLSEKFGVSGIPALIILKPDGTVITKEGRAAVQSKPPKAALSSWKA